MLLVDIVNRKHILVLQHFKDTLINWLNLLNFTYV